VVYSKKEKKRLLQSIDRDGGIVMSVVEWQ